MPWILGLPTKALSPLYQVELEQRSNLHIIPFGVTSQPNNYVVNTSVINSHTAWRGPTSRARYNPSAIYFPVANTMVVFVTRPIYFGIMIESHTENTRVVAIYRADRLFFKALVITLDRTCSHTNISINLWTPSHAGSTRNRVWWGLSQTGWWNQQRCINHMQHPGLGWGWNQAELRSIVFTLETGHIWNFQCSAEPSSWGIGIGLVGGHSTGPHVD